MKPLIVLDFDGVLFNSAFEAYQVCENTVRGDPAYRHGLTFDDFMAFRGHLTDAWQFNRLYRRVGALHLQDYDKLYQIEPEDDDWAFTTRFFSTRAEMMKDPDWAKFMSPYPFFYQLRPLISKYTDYFRILSTRNRESIQRTLDFFEVDGLRIFGQEDIREHGSKLGVANAYSMFDQGSYVVYVDDMSSHLEPFDNDADLCIHANWGYDCARSESYSQTQAFKIIDALLKLGLE